MDIVSILIEGTKIAVAPILAAITAIWVFKRQEREKIHCYVDWDWIGSGPDPEISFVAIQNRSTSSAMISRFEYRIGLLKSTNVTKIAIYWEDPSDLNFPFEITEGAIRKFRLNEYEIAQLASEVGRVSQVLRRCLKRPRIWLRVTTMAGTRTTFSLERAIPYKLRPEQRE